MWNNTCRSIEMETERVNIMAKAKNVAKVKIHRGRKRMEFSPEKYQTVLSHIKATGDIPLKEMSKHHVYVDLMINRKYVTVEKPKQGEKGRPKCVFQLTKKGKEYLSKALYKVRKMNATPNIQAVEPEQVTAESEQASEVAA
jgi:hypothetical protein